MAATKNQVIEINGVVKSHCRLDRRKKEAWQNEGITRHRHENK
jgi:hypothetical protein